MLDEASPGNYVKIKKEPQLVVWQVHRPAGYALS